MFGKKTFLTVLLAVSIPGSLWASLDSGGTEGSICTSCDTVQTANGPRLKNNLGVVAGSLEKINDTMKFAGQCKNFADNGKLGAWAKSIREEYMTSSLPYLDKGTSDIHKYCPTYSEMKPTDKANFWVLVLNAMSHFENSCNTSNKKAAQGPNGQLVGILQLHSQKEGDYVPKGADCDDGDGKTAEGSFRCAMIMLNSQLKNQKALFARKSYWDVLRPQAASQRVPLIISSIKKYLPCQNESMLNARQYSTGDSQNEANAYILNALQNVQYSDEFNNEIWNANDMTPALDIEDNYQL